LVLQGAASIERNKFYSRSFLTFLSEILNVEFRPREFNYLFHDLLNVCAVSGYLIRKLAPSMLEIEPVYARNWSPSMLEIEPVYARN
jgi:hypothetical protein